MRTRALFIVGFASIAACTGEEPDVCTELEEVFVYADHDGDGYGTDEPIGWVCQVAQGQSLNNVDCDDEAADVHPEAPELCDQQDNDCNGRVDEAVAKAPWYLDADGDGFGDPETREVDCAAPSPRHIPLAGDCDDTSAEVNPAERELCNGLDDDCDRFVDDDDPGVDPATYDRFYRDGDSDGYGDPNVFEDRCERPPGTVTDDTDCDDTRAAVNPAGSERCNRLDDDCDGLIDDGDDSLDPSTQNEFFADADGDGAGDADQLVMACGPIPGIASLDDTDCDDTDPEAILEQNWYTDADQDGYGVGAPVTFACNDPGGLAPETERQDCDDADFTNNPGIPEDCTDGFDQNCDTYVDAADPQCVEACADRGVAPIAPIVLQGTTSGAGNDATPPNSCGFSLNATDIALDWTVPADGTYDIDLQGSTYNTILHVYDGCGGTMIACNDNLIGQQAGVQVELTAGQVVIIVVDGYANASGAFTLHID